MYMERIGNRVLTSDEKEIIDNYKDYLLNLAETISQRYGRRFYKISDEEFYDGAIDGLLKAARKYEEDRGLTFRKFAGMHIDFGIRDVLTKYVRLEDKPQTYSTNINSEEFNPEQSDYILEDFKTPSGFDVMCAKETLDDLVYGLNPSKLLTVDMKLLGYRNIDIAEALDKSRTYVCVTMKQIRERMERKNYLWGNSS